MADEALDTGVTPDTAPDPVQATKDAALSQMAKDEDISNYAAEREARDKEARGEEANGEDRSERIRKALAEARQSTQEARQLNGLDNPDLDQQYQTAEQEWQQAEQGEQDYQSEIETARNEGRFTAVAEELKAANPAAHSEITNALGYLDAAMTPEQSKLLVREITKGNPREAMVALHRLTMPTVQDDGSTITPAMKLEYLASLPPDQLGLILSQSRQYVQMEHDISTRLSRQYANQPRRVSKAPPPFKRVTGGATPPQNLNALASKSENPSDYIKLRQQQLKRGRDE